MVKSNITLDNQIMSTEIKGSIVAIVTPMHGDGSLDLRAFDRLVNWHVEAGTNGIVAVSYTHLTLPTIYSV